MNLSGVRFDEAYNEAINRGEKFLTWQQGDGSWMISRCTHKQSGIDMYDQYCAKERHPEAFILPPSPDTGHYPLRNTDRSVCACGAHETRGDAFAKAYDDAKGELCAWPQSDGSWMVREEVDKKGVDLLGLGFSIQPEEIAQVYENYCAKEKPEGAFVLPRWPGEPSHYPKEQADKSICACGEKKITSQNDIGFLSLWRTTAFVCFIPKK